MGFFLQNIFLVVVISEFVFLTFIVLSSFLGDIIFSFLFFRLSFIQISGSDVLFWKLSISGYSLPFSSLYMGSPSMFVSIKVLHFIFLFSFLQLCSIGLCSSSNYWCSWNTNLCISKHFSFSCSYLLQSF